MTKGSNMDNAAVAENSLKQMADYLENILVRHLERVRKYDLDGAVVLAEEANEIAATLGRDGMLKRPEHIEQRRKIETLYKDISLIIASEREEVSDKLKVIRKGIKTLGVYGESM
jgi:hypothetical protein